MNTLPQIASVSWMVYGIYWALSARGVKKDRKRNRRWWDSFLFRFLIVLAIAIFPWYRLPFGPPRSFFLPTSNSVLRIIGLVLCEGGIAFAIWARREIRRNWSSGPAIKEGHELITSGPYSMVRHPIYTGILTALLGTSILCGVQWCIVLWFIGTTFVFRIPEEKIFMTQLFPNLYSEYKKSTAALVPFIW